MSALRFAFLGSDAIALPLLNWLVTAGTGVGRLVMVYTQPDRPVGRGQKITPNAIKTWALARGLPVVQPEKLIPEVQADFGAQAVDLAIVMAYGHILRDDFIATPRLGTVNLHASWLPRYRGASPIQTAIACGERETAVTLMRIVRRLDAGPIADVEPVPIRPTDTAIEVEARLASACVPLLERTLGPMTQGTLAFTPQDDTAATYCRKLEKSDGVLDFAAPAAALAARINGLHPWPGCSVDLSGEALKFGLATAEDGPSAGPVVGTVLAPDSESLRIVTGRGVLRVHRLQRAGGKMIPAADFLRGVPIAPGTVLPSRPMPSLVAPTPFKK